MRLLAGVTLALLVGCELEPPAAGPVAARRDALEVLVVGSPGAALGEIVSSCSTTPLFAGLSEVRADVFILTPVSSVTALSCTPGMNPVYVAGANPGGLGTASAATWAFSGGAVNSLARNPQSGTLLVGREGGRVQAFIEGMMGLPTFDAGSVALAWAPDGTLFAAASSTKVDVFTWNASTSTAVLRNSIPVGAGVRRHALVLGDFLPNGTRDVAVGTVDGRVLVFDEYGGAGLVLSGDGGTFGTALAVESNYLATLDALLIGEPGADRVVRMIGDAGRGQWSGAAGDRFGAAMTVLSNRKLLIGAPGADGGAGAIFFEALIAPGGGVDDPFSCNVFLPCSIAHPSQCFEGTCVGGVACINQTPGCRAGSVCVFDGAGYECVPMGSDAGLPDAGYDAGTDDAGAEDAGVDDAGVDDAGVDAGADAGAEDAGTDGGTDDADAGAIDAGATIGVTFSARGCSSVGGTLPWLLALFFRWRR